MTNPALPVAVLPADVRPHIRDAVADGGGQLVDPEHARVLVWTDPHDAAGIAEVLAANPQIEVVQLLWAGVEDFHARGLFDDGRVWLNGKGVYAEPVAEHALGLGLALLRGLPERIRARSWGPQWGTSLVGGRVTIFGGGGIAESLIRLLGPFDTDITVVRRSGQPLPGATQVLTPDRSLQAVEAADLVVLALALTPETQQLVNHSLLEGFPSHACLVNVARGGHVDTDDLVWALESRVLAGAGLDVTDPEPLPEGHPLWGQRNVIITPHTANTEEMAVPIVSRRVRTNIQRLIAGQDPVGVVDPARGY